MQRDLPGKPSGRSPLPYHLPSQGYIQTVLHDDVNGIDQFLGSAILQEIAGAPALSILMRNPDPNAWKGPGLANPESSARIRLVASIHSDQAC